MTHLEKSLDSATASAFSDQEDEQPYQDDAADVKFEMDEEDYVIPYTIRTWMTTQECAEWTQLIHVRATHKEKIIGRADGRYIDRDQIREYFQDAMDEPSQDTAEFASDLFDSRGRLKSELRAGEGSGIWGSEMNTGGILLLETIEVEKDWRGKGIGRDIMEAFMKKGQRWKDDVEFVFAKPGQPNTQDNRYRQEGMAEQHVIAAVARDRNLAIAFWRALGFRRVASSDWFATTFDELHTVHQLAVEDDYDPQEDDI